MTDHWLAMTIYGATQSVFNYPKHRMLTLDTTEFSSLFGLSPLLCRQKEWKTKYGNRALKLLQDTN